MRNRERLICGLVLSVGIMVVAALAPVSAYAQAVTNGPAPVKAVSINSGVIFIQLDEADPSVSNGKGCANFGGWFRRPYTSEMDKIHSGIALTAYATGKKLKIISDACEVGYNNIITIQVRDN